MFVNIIKADAPSIHGYLYSEDTLRKVVESPPCKLYSRYCDTNCSDEFIIDNNGEFIINEDINPAVGKVLSYCYENGWLQADIHFHCPHFASLVKDGHRVVRAAVRVATMVDTDANHTIVGIEYLAICNPGEASWSESIVKTSQLMSDQNGNDNADI